MSVRNSVRLPLNLEWMIGIAIACFLGILSATSYTWLLLAGVAPVIAWLAYRYPPVTVVAFWFSYLLQTTIFAGSAPIQGIYYPLYLLMGANFLTYLRDSRKEFTVPLLVWLLYAAFYGITLLSLLWQPTGVIVDTPQRLFIYSLGLLTVSQIRTRQHVKMLYVALVVGAFIVSGWTIMAALGSFFAYRGGIDVNPNYAANLISFGLIPLFVFLTDTEQRSFRFMRVPLWIGFLAGNYAMLLLASRGVTVALLLAGVVVVFRNGVRTPGRMLVLLSSLVLCGYLVVQLPGAGNLVQRLSEANTESFNDRLPLWSASLHEFAAASVQTQLLGQGMGASEVLVRHINPLYTSVHNGFLQILFDFGLIGVLLFVSLIRAVWTRTSQMSDYIGTTGLALITFMVVASVTATLQDGFLFWIALGITLAQATGVQEVQHAT